MRTLCRVASGLVLSSCMLMTSAHADDRDGRGRGALYNIAHFDVIPATVGGVDFLQVGYGLLFKYRDASNGDPGLQSFRLLNVIAPETNHSEIVQVWNSRDAYERHLASRHTIDFRFNVQGNFASCCVGSPIDDRQYQLVQSFNAAWQSIPALGVGTSGALYVVTYVEFLPDEQAVPGQEALLQYGFATSKANGGHVLSYSVLRQLDRPDRYAVLEAWDAQANYNAWQAETATTSFNGQIKRLLASPLDRRPTVLCGATYVDNVGCTAP